MAVTDFRIPKDKLLAAIRIAAKDSSKLVFLPAIEKRAMAGMMTYRQVIKCLEEGRIGKGPKRNEHGHWALTLERYSAHRWLSIDVVAECEGATVRRIYILHGANNVSI